MSAKIDWLHHESITKANYCDTCCHQYSDICGGCETLEGVPVKYREKTNADRIRNMTDEELADFICKTQFAFIPRSLGNIPISVYDGMSVLKWLKQEVSDDS